MDFLGILNRLERWLRLRQTARQRVIQVCLLLSILAAPLSALAQEQPQEPTQEPAADSAQDQAQPMTLDRTLTTLHGVVRNASTGEGLPRVLVRIEGDANTGALTDGEGRFEIPNIPVGPQSVSVQKPGFLDRSPSPAGASQGAEQFVVAVPGGSHNILVAAQMPDVVFALEPTGAIRGQVELSTGDPGEGIPITLVQRTVQDGRAIWQQAGSAKTHSDGTFRFGGLADGDYALFSQPAMDTDLDGTPGGVGGQRRGYPTVYYPGAREPLGAGRIRVAGGQETQVNLTLTMEPFQTVTAEVVFPQGSFAERAGMNLAATVMDSAGHALPYPVQYDERSRSVQAALPDGTYSFLVSSNPQTERRPGQGSLNAGALAGSVELTVAGRPVPNLRVALSAARPVPVQVNVQRSAGAGIAAGTIDVLVSQASGWIDDVMVSSFAHGGIPGPLEAVYTRPGAYWVHTHIQSKGVCESSFTAGGANLAREPLVLGSRSRGANGADAAR